jgi:hypothetical protein
VTPEAYAHFHSSLRYSTQALPLNTLLDTLIRPNADTEINPESCVAWQYEPKRAISHIVLSSGARPGGQWIENPASASWDIGTLSYSEMLSLPGYTYAQHYWIRNGTELPDLQRPTRTEVADYFAAYPEAVGIASTLYTSNTVEGVARTTSGFSIRSHGISCKHLVLATGIFTVSITPPALLVPVSDLCNSEEPLLIIGSGFSAADVIISVPPNQKILHLFRWSPEKKPSPLRGCHHQAYPEYARIYRQMKLAAMSSRSPTSVFSPMMRRKSNPFFVRRDWAAVYEGLPNAEIVDVQVVSGAAKVRLRLESGEIIDRTVGSLAYMVGRRGQLDYLDEPLRREVLDTQGSDASVIPTTGLISGRTLRGKAEVNFEVAQDVFIIGSLTGDSLIRHSFGSCVYTASTIMGEKRSVDGLTCTEKESSGGAISNGMAHQDLHIDRRENSRHPSPRFIS